MYRQSAAKKGIQLRLIKNTEIYTMIDNHSLTIKLEEPFEEPDFILFLDKDIRLAKQLERMGLKLFNRADTTEACDDKIITHQLLAHQHIRTPKTLFSPLMFQGTDEIDNHFTKVVEQQFTFPLVIKEAFGSFGAQVYLIRNHEELLAKRKELLYTPHLYQEFISSSFGKDARLFVVGEKVVASMYRTNNKDFRANITNGGEAQMFNPPESFIELAVKASKAVGADFSGVDILFGENGEPIICEVNSNAHIKNVFDCTGVDVSAHIIDYVLEKMADD